MRTRRHVTAMTAAMAGLLAMASTSWAQGGKIVCDGVIGNSGATGKATVRFGLPEARGMGVAIDRFGSLWDRAGRGTLNRYAADGRLLAQYPIDKGANGTDQLTLADDTLVLLVAGRLYTLDVAAAAGTAPRKSDVQAEHISYGANGSRVVAVDRDGGLFFFDAVTHRREPICSLAEHGRAEAVELGPDATVYVQLQGKMRRLQGCGLDAGYVAAVPGERPQLLDGWWFGNAWHGTVRRFDAKLQPDPGVVLGGASGSFIGHLDQNPEVSNGRGMAKVGENLFGVSGIGGVMHLLAWQPAQRKMEIVRRIGALPSVGGLGLDRAGRIWAVAGCWQWSDRPDTPMLLGVNAPDAPGIAQAVMLPNDAMVAPTYCWGKPSFYFGPLNAEVDTRRIESNCAFRRGAVASTAYRRNNQTLLLTADAKGKAQAFRISSSGQFQADAGDVELRAATPTSEWTSLAARDDQVLLAAADGCVIELAPDGDHWKETRRWRSWGADGKAHFGKRIYLTVDAGRLWVADTDRHRVLCFDVQTGKVVATFGAVDAAGTELTSMDAPARIAARDRRAVVFDSGNQRLLKLRLE